MIRFCIKKINSLCYAVPYVFYWLGGHAILSNYWMRLSMIWRIMQMEKGVAEVDNSFRVLHNTAALCHIYPANKASFCLLEWGGEKEVLPGSPQTLKLPQPELLDWSTLFFFCQTFFFECEHRFIDKSLRITEPAVPSTRLLVLGSKLYPTACSECSTKILLDSRRVFCKYAEIKQGNERLWMTAPLPHLSQRLNPALI